MTGADDRRMKLIEWEPIGKGMLLGRATVELDGLVISQIGIFAKEGSRWAQLPAEVQRDREGGIIKDERGKAKYKSTIRWRNRELQERFSFALISAIEAKHGALGGSP
jgi:hypothetical protein